MQQAYVAADVVAGGREVLLLLLQSTCSPTACQFSEVERLGRLIE
jgi:hypothetical protein